MGKGHQPGCREVVEPDFFVGAHGAPHHGFAQLGQIRDGSAELARYSGGLGHVGSGLKSSHWTPFNSRTTATAGLNYKIGLFVEPTPPCPQSPTFLSFIGSDHAVETCLSFMRSTAPTSLTKRIATSHRLYLAPYCSIIAWSWSKPSFS